MNNLSNNIATVIWNDFFARPFNDGKDLFDFSFSELEHAIHSEISKFHGLPITEKKERIFVENTPKAKVVLSLDIAKEKKTNLGKIKPVVKKSNRIPKGSIPIQETPITIDNFFVSTMGDFTEIDRIPSGFTSFFKSKGSEYFTNDDKSILIRVSDHWGGNIKFCSWYLKGVKKCSSWTWQKKHGKNKRIGQIYISELSVNSQYCNHTPVTSRHPVDTISIPAKELFNKSNKQCQK